MSARMQARRRTVPPMHLLISALAGLVLSGCGGDPPDARDVEADDPGAEVHAPPVTGPVDWHLAGGRIVDGSGSEPRMADVLVQDDRIVFVGPVDPDTLEILERFDATGMVITPGFIDSHAHGDPLSTPAFENFLAQGVTTILLGQDGSSPPAGELGAHLSEVERSGVVPNVAYLAGHNTLRGESGLGFGTGSDEAALAPLVGLVETALEAGAFGLSLGLEYTPGQLAGDEELAAMARPVAARNGVVMSHMRTEDAGAVAGAVDELLEVRRRTGARVHVSHMKVVLGSDPGEATGILSMIQEARAATAGGSAHTPDGTGGVTGDVYPYLASFTGIAILFPDWARPPNDYDAVRAERGDELAAHLRDRVNARNGPEATLFGTGPWAGRTLAEAAEAEGRPFEELLVELGPGGARAAYFVMDPGVMSVFLTDPHVAISSDGSPTMGHPRGYGSFARVIRQYVLDEGLLTLEEAVRKMSALPASIIGLDDDARVEVPRGRILPGWAADLAVFDPEAFIDRADFQDPHTLAEGMAGVWVNGTLSWTGGAPVASARDGRVLRDRGSPPSPEAPTEDLSDTESSPSHEGG